MGGIESLRLATSVQSACEGPEKRHCHGYEPRHEQENENGGVAFVGSPQLGPDVQMEDERLIRRPTGAGSVFDRKAGLANHYAPPPRPGRAGLGSVLRRKGNVQRGLRKGLDCVHMMLAIFEDSRVVRYAWGFNQGVELLWLHLHPVETLWETPGCRVIEVKPAASGNRSACKPRPCRARLSYVG